MAHLRVSQMALLASLMAALLAAAAAQSSSSCTSALVSLSPCLNYITGNETSPSSSCCSQLASVVKSEPQCLCSVLSGGAASSLGISINQTQALALPGACKVQTPPASQCNTSPATPSPPSAGTPAPNGSSGSGSKSGSTTLDTGSAYGNSAKVYISLTLSLLVLMLTSTASAITA